ncbi:MAG: hypothetical protein KKA79_00455 [Nanoarchaeota archaeon]|nr:hypothetical protein [Nanoarchaeota archaeon]
MASQSGLLALDMMDRDAMLRAMKRLKHATEHGIDKIIWNIIVEYHELPYRRGFFSKNKSEKEFFEEKLVKDIDKGAVKSAGSQIYLLRKNVVLTFDIRSRETKTKREEITFFDVRKHTTSPVSLMPLHDVKGVVEVRRHIFNLRYRGFKSRKDLLIINSLSETEKPDIIDIDYKGVQENML